MLKAPLVTDMGSGKLQDDTAMTDESTPTPPKIPPKLNLKPPEKPERKTAAPGEAPPTENREERPAAKPPVPAADPDAPTLTFKPAPPPDVKKKTSRISLDAALSMRISEAMDAIEKEEAVPTPTVRLKRPGAPQPAAHEAESGPPPREKAPDDTGAPKGDGMQRPESAPNITVLKPSRPTAHQAKSKTSRIHLESALKSGIQDGGTGVKTIRLKRPGGASAPPIHPPIHPPTAETPEADGDQSTKSRTARLDIPDSSGPPSDAATPTQRKTIRIKRPDGTRGTPPARTLSLARSKPGADTDAGVEKPAAKDETATARPGTRDPGLVFTLAVLAAVAVAGVLVYVLAVQAFPNADLSWPGQIVL